MVHMHGIGGDGEYCGDNDAQLDRINLFYSEASGGINVPRAVFFDFEPGVIDAVRASPLGELFRPGNLVNVFRLRPGNLVNHTRGKNGPKTITEGLTQVFLAPGTKAPSTNSSPPTPPSPPVV